MTDETRSEIPVDEQIVKYMHCLRCMDGRPEDQSPREWARLNVGMTPIGFQVWCVRHDLNVLHIDFEGRRPRAADWALRSQGAGRGGPDRRITGPRRP